MTALIIETSHSPALLALSQGKKILQSTTLSPQELHIHIQKILTSFDYLAIGIGPGSYVGSRTAVTIGKTLSFALNKPIVPFPSPLAFLPDDYTGPFTYIADAKMGQFALFEGEIEENGVILSPFTLVEKQTFCPTPGRRLIHQGEAICPTWVAAYVSERYERGEVYGADELAAVYYR
jgi:tRNA A37 threonylcarbamoyladenosine modification protein TsaB